MPSDKTPIHITQLVPGDAVRIALKAGRHLEPVLRGKQQTVYMTGRNGKKSLRAKPFSRTVALGFITENNSEAGVMTLQVEDRGKPRRHFQAIIPYKDMLVIRKYVTPSERDVKDVPIGGGGNAIRRPGIVGKGFDRASGFMKLIRVTF